MYVNGCKIDVKLCAENPEGFSSVVSRTNAKGEEVARGPFAVIREAQVYAHSWNDADTPPPMPVATTTVSESVAVQVEKPVENPPVIEEKAAETT
jgi:hypothetical protein